ncbi:MAG: twin-arginine translocation signal domain-containing protein [Dehalococcoidia bacterium]
MEANNQASNRRGFLSAALGAIAGIVAGTLPRPKRPSTTSFRVLLNKPAPTDVTVGWFIVN